MITKYNKINKNSKRILFLIKNIRSQRYGTLCLSAYLKQEGHVVDYVHALGENKLQDIFNRMEEFKPDYLAITAMSGEIKFFLKILKHIKASLPNLYVVLGGAHATFSPDIIENPLIDAVCRGEGEEAFTEFLEKHPNKDYLSVRNFSFKNGNKIIHNPLRSLVDINKLPTPDFDFIKRQVGETIVLFVSRNCIFNCAYCFNKKYRQMYKDAGHGNTYRHMTLDKTFEDLKNIKDKYAGQFKFFYFLDDVFPTNLKWLTAFSERYPKEIGIPFHVGINPALIKETTIKLLKKAGCFSVNLAIESGSKRIRKIMNRPNMSNEQIIEACHILKKYKIYINTQNIIMSPTETIGEAKQTLELNIACKIDNGVVGKFQPYPGTEMARFTIEKGLVDEKNLLDRLPEDYHWESLLKFDKKQAIQMDNLLHLFSFTIKYPFMKRVVYKVIKYEWDWLFHRIDNQFWMTHTHRSMESVYNRYTLVGSLQSGLRHLLFIKRLFFPKKKSDFVY